MEEKKITMADVEVAFDRFVKGTDKAGQHEFFNVMIIQVRLMQWKDHLREEWNEEIARRFIKFVDDAIKHFGW